MGITSKNNLKGYFNKGDRPRESQFVDLIDSFVHINDNSSPLTSSHDISSSGIITAEDIIIGDDLTVGDNINLGSGGKLNFNGPTSEQYILGQNNGIEIVGVITSSNNISSSGIIYAANIIIDSLPTSEAAATSNGFFTLSGSQIPLSGSTAQLNAISESKFVFQK